MTTALFVCACAATILFVAAVVVPAIPHIESVLITLEMAAGRYVAFPDLLAHGYPRTALLLILFGKTAARSIEWKLTESPATCGCGMIPPWHLAEYSFRRRARGHPRQVSVFASGYA